MAGRDGVQARQQDGRRVQVVGRQLEQVDALGERATQHRQRRHPRRVAGQHVHDPGGERPDPQRTPGCRAGDRAPAVEDVRAAQLLVDHELHRRPGEAGAQARERLAQHGSGQRVRAQARRERVGHQPVRVTAEPVAQLHQHVHDLGDRGVERRARFGARPHQRVEVEVGGDEASAAGTEGAPGPGDRDPPGDVADLRGLAVEGAPGRDGEAHRSPPLRSVGASRRRCDTDSLERSLMRPAPP